MSQISRFSLEIKFEFAPFFIGMIRLQIKYKLSIVRLTIAPQYARHAIIILSKICQMAGYHFGSSYRMLRSRFQPLSSNDPSTYQLMATNKKTMQRMKTISHRPVKNQVTKST